MHLEIKELPINWFGRSYKLAILARYVGIKPSTIMLMLLSISKDNGMLVSLA